MYEKFTADYRGLTNLKEGVMTGANNPRIRAAMENCKKDSNGKPIFEAEGVTYPACPP